MMWRLGLSLVLLLAVGCSAGPPSAASKHMTYVALGASDAVGVGASHPETEGWVPRFGASLGPNARVVNLGVSGSTLAQALQEQLPPALDAHPDVVTIWLAVNDLNARTPLERYAADLDTLLGQLEALQARVLVGNIPDLAGVAAYRGVNPEPLQAEVDRWNAVIGEAVQRHGARLVDLHATWQEVNQHPEYLASDGFHPSTEGYARLAELFEAAYAGRA